MKPWEDAFDIYNQILDCPSVEDATAFLSRMVSNAGFVAFSYLAVDGRRGVDGVPVHLTTLKQDFVDDYVKGSWWDLDPAVLICGQVKTPYMWRDAYAFGKRGDLPGSDWQGVDDLARSHGYREGCIMPMRTLKTSFSLTLTCDQAVTREDIDPALNGMGLVGLAFDEWMTANVPPPPPPNAAEVLSRITKRERDVLHWLMEGKTSEDIGDILSISTKTVDYHVANIMKKLDAINRVQAVARAVRLGFV